MKSADSPSRPASTVALPDGYTFLEKIDLKENKKLMLLVSLLSLLMMVPLGIIGHLWVPFQVFMAMNTRYWLTLLCILVPMFIYVILHEAVHGIFMRIYGGVKPHFGVISVYAYAGSKAYFNRFHYMIIGLSPIAIWGVVLAVVCLLVPREWFWYAYFIQIMNLSGAAGDLYVTVRMLKMPRDILVQDSGVAMSVYSRSEKLTDPSK